MKSIFVKLKGNGFFTSVMKVGSGNLIGQLLSLISTPILSRIYSTTAYGDQAIITSTATIIVNLSILGLSSAIMEPRDDIEAKKIFTTGFWCNFIIGTALISICLIGSNCFKLFNISQGYFLGLFLTWLYIIIVNTQLMSIVYTNRKGHYNKLFLNPIIGAICNILIAIPLGLLGVGFSGFLLTTIISNLIMLIHMSSGENPFYKGFRLQDAFYVIRRYKEYILFQCPSNFVQNIATEMPAQVLNRYFTTQELGGYSMCLRMLKYPVRLIAAPISTVYFKTASEYHKEKKNLALFTYKMISRILLFSLIPVAGCSLVAESMFAFFLGNQWREAGTIASVLVTQYMMLFCSQCVSYCRVAIGRQKANFVFYLVRLIMVTIACIGGYYITGTMLGTIVFFSVVNSVLYIMDMALNFYYLDKRYLAKYLLLSLGYVILMGCMVSIKLLFQ